MRSARSPLQKRTYLLIGLLLALQPTGENGARAQASDRQDICTARTNASDSERIKACSELIESGSFADDHLAILYTSRASASRASGDLDAALADQNKAIEIAPESAILYFNRAVTWQAKQDNAQAIDDYNNSLRIAPNFALAYKRRGDLFFSNAEYDRAIDDYDNAVRLKPDFAEALARRGLAKLHKGDVEGRNADLQAARFIDSGTVRGLLKTLGNSAPEGEGFLVRRQLGVFTALELNEATICQEANETSTKMLKTYFDAYGMTYTAKTFPDFVDAQNAYENGDCTVLAGGVTALRSARETLPNATDHVLLAEVYASTAVSTGKHSSDLNSAPAASLWNHNGSLVRLQSNGSSRAFYYQTPREVIKGQGVSSGALLFQGTRDQSAYEGTAYLFKKGCKPIGYAVSGTVSEDEKTITMSGSAPTRGDDCSVLGYKDDSLVFTFIEP